MSAATGEALKHANARYRQAVGTLAYAEAEYRLAQQEHESASIAQKQAFFRDNESEEV